MRRAYRYLAFALAGAPLLGTGGCDVADSVLETIFFSFRIVDVWV